MRPIVACATRTSTKRIETVGAALSRLAEQVSHVAERVDKIDRRQLHHLEEAISQLQYNTRRQATLAERLVRASQQGSEHEVVRERALQADPAARAA
jgi:septal ring factor EnvC (AmiA/AmiB activator)